MAEVAFRAYERRALAGDVEAMGGDVVDLAALNFNDSQVPRAKPAGELRVLSLGDSFAYGIVQYPYTYHRRAAEVLEPAAGGPGVRIVDLGEPAVSFVQYASSLRQWERVLEHDGLLLTVYLGNDVLDVAYRYVPDDRGRGSVFADMPFSIQTGRARLGAVPQRYGLRMLDYGFAFWRMRTASVRTVVDDPRYNRAVLLLTEDEFLDNQRTQLDNFDPGKLEALRAGYRAAADVLRLVAERRRQGRLAAVVLAPNQAQVDATLRATLASRFGVSLDALDLALPAQVLSRLAAAIDNGLPVIDLTASLRCAQEEGQPVHYRTDTHWSVEGNRLAGEVVGVQLARHWLGRTSPAEVQRCARVDRETRPLPLRPANEAAVRAYVAGILGP